MSLDAHGLHSYTGYHQLDRAVSIECEATAFKIDETVWRLRHKENCYYATRLLPARSRTQAGRAGERMF